MWPPLWSLTPSMLCLARRGHTLTGVDYSPASVAHARKTAERDALKVTVIEGDMRTTEFAGPYDAAMLIAGELNTLQPVEARDVVRRVVDALEPGGHFLIEVSTYESTQRGGHERQRWYGMPSGLWSDDPHMVLEESFWDEETETATARWFAVDAASGEVRRYAATYQAYTNDGYRELLSSAGLAEIRELEAMGEGTADPKLTVFVASRPVKRRVVSSASQTVFESSMAIVIGPTPPGTGVMAPAISRTGS